MNLPEIIAEANRLSAKIDRGVSELAKASQQLAQAEHDYRKAVGEAWLHAPEGTVPERDAWVKSSTAGLRLERDMRDGLRLSALEALRSRRAQLSALQSIAAAWRAEAEHAKYGPEVAA